MAVQSETNIDLRKRLLRRLIWKLPLIIALVSFAVWWQLKHNTQRAVDNESPAANSRLSSLLAGSWTAEVSYGSGERRREEFFFQPEGGKLYGTVTFLGTKRGIEDGKIAGSMFSFNVKFEEVTDSATQVRVNRYEGTLVGNELHLKLNDVRGNAPVEFSLVASNSASGESAKSQR